MSVTVEEHAELMDNRFARALAAQEAREEAACPRCSAQPGGPCINKRGLKFTGLRAHSERIAVHLRALKEQA